MRRLTLAACDLQQTGGKVIDIAMKYGYDTPESFSRAFARFHHITPPKQDTAGASNPFPGCPSN
jgi:AraC family transcriptional regulator